MTSPDFLTDIRAEVFKWLPHDQSDQPTVAALSDFEAKLSSDPKHLEAHFIARGKSTPIDPVFHAVLLNGPAGLGFGIREDHTGSIFPIDA